MVYQELKIKINFKISYSNCRTFSTKLYWKCDL